MHKIRDGFHRYQFESSIKNHIFSKHTNTQSINVYFVLKMGFLVIDFHMLVFRSLSAFAANGLWLTTKIQYIYIICETYQI